MERLGEGGLEGQVRSLSFGHIKAVMSISHPSGDGKWAVGYKSLQFRGKVWAVDIELRVLGA